MDRKILIGAGVLALGAAYQFGLLPGSGGGAPAAEPADSHAVAVRTAEPYAQETAVRRASTATVTPTPATKGTATPTPRTVVKKSPTATPTRVTLVQLRGIGAGTQARLPVATPARTLPSSPRPVATIAFLPPEPPPVPGETATPTPEPTATPTPWPPSYPPWFPPAPPPVSPTERPVRAPTESP